MVSRVYLDGKPVLGDIDLTGEVSGAQTTANFLARLLRLLGDTRILLAFSSAGASLVESSRNQRVLTWSEGVGAFDSPPARLGAGVQVEFNGSDEDGSIPDSADLVFGDGVVDEALSLFALMYVDSTASAMDILAKHDDTLDKGLVFGMSSAGKVGLSLHDESLGGIIGLEDSAALTVATWTLMLHTYDGTGVSSGCRVFKNGLSRATSDLVSGSYTAMEANSQVVSLGYSLDNAVKVNRLNGRLALVGLVAKEVLEGEAWAMKELVNGYFGLSL